MMTSGGTDRAALGAEYNLRARVPEFQDYFDRYDATSEALRVRWPGRLDLAYGDTARQAIDLFLPDATDPPLLAFIHGGYWQMRAKEIFRFLATGPLAHGINVANVAYTLAPQATLQEIVDEARHAIDWLAWNADRYGADARRLYVSGWSAGGHLTAMSMSHRAVCGGVAISGIFDLEPIRLSYLNEKLRLTAEDVGRLSPLANLPSSSPPLVVACGTGELPELQRQSREYAAARERAGLPTRFAPLEGHNHFSILEELANPEGTLTSLLLEMTA